MIGALRESRDGSASDDARTLHANRKRPAVRGKVCHWQSVFLKKAGAHVQANSVRAPMKSRHQIALATYPLGIVRCAAGKGRVEKRMPEAADVDREHKLSRYSQFAQSRSHAPSRIFIESCEMQFSFLRGNRRQIVFARGHEAVPCTDCTEVPQLFCYRCGNSSNGGRNKVATHTCRSGAWLRPAGRILTQSKDRASAESKSIISQQELAKAESARPPATS